MYIKIPRLPTRQDGENFYMYLTIENNQAEVSLKWKSEIRLKNNFDFYKARHSKLASLLNQNNFREIIQFWVNMAVSDLPLKEEWEPVNRVQKAWEHITFYCEECCYKAAISVWKDDTTKSWEEYVFLSRCLIYDFQRFQPILTKYNPDASALDTYITKILINTIKNETLVGKYSHWRLLVQTGDNKLKEALLRAGIYEPDISKFMFARKYFKQVYQMNKIQNPIKAGKKWQEPDGNDFIQAAVFYNAEKLLASTPHEVNVNGDVTAKELKAWMNICINALYNYPKSIVPSFSVEALEEKGNELENNEALLSIDNLEITQNQAKSTKITELALQNQFMKLKHEQQKILLLYYGLQLQQKQIAEIYEITQGAIARRLQTIEIKLLKTVLKLSQPAEWTTQYVSGWLISNYSSPDNLDLIHAVLIETIKTLASQEQEILKLVYVEKLNQDIIANRFGISQVEVASILRMSKSKLELAIIQAIDKYISKYLRFWLSKFCRQQVKLTCKNLRILTSDIRTLKTINLVLDKSLEHLQLDSNRGENNVVY
jgi:RNA polymerase sigma factor (sigma-70 family)